MVILFYLFDLNFIPISLATYGKLTSLPVWSSITRSGLGHGRQDEYLNSTVEARITIPKPSVSEPVPFSDTSTQ